jgi:hypothetical protein
VVDEIAFRLNSGNEDLIISGLRSLKSVLKAYEFEIDEERKPLFTIVDKFLPMLESLTQYVTSGQSP